MNRGRDPNDFINAKGLLPNDRAHMVRVQGSVDVPWIDAFVGASYQFLSGTPWAATANVRLPQGRRQIFLEPRGSLRLPSQNLLDVRLSKPFELGSGRRIELLVDVLNVLDDSSHHRVRTTNLFSPVFGEGRSFVRPRRAMIGLKATF